MGNSKEGGGGQTFEGSEAAKGMAKCFNSERKTSVRGNAQRSDACGGEEGNDGKGKHENGNV